MKIDEKGFSFCFLQYLQRVYIPLKNPKNKGAEKFLGGGGDYPGVEMIGRYHAPGSLEGWIVVKTDDPKAIYQHAAEWGEFLNWATTPVFTDEEAGPIVAKVYS